MPRGPAATLSYFVYVCAGSLKCMVLILTWVFKVLRCDYKRKVNYVRLPFVERILASRSQYQGERGEKKIKKNKEEHTEGEN